MLPASQLSLLINIINSSYDAIISKGTDSIITSWNPAAEKIFGYTAEEAIGRHIYLIIPNDFIHEEVDIMNKILAGQSIEHYETTRKRKDGKNILVSISISPILDTTGNIIGASKIARDITELVRAKESIEQNEIRFKNLLENNKDVVQVFDENIRPIYSSPNIERVTGWTIEELNSSNSKDLIHPDYHKQLALSYEVVKNNPGLIVDFEYPLRHKNGNYIWIEGSAKNMLNDSSINGIISSYRDISERKQAEEELKKAYAEVNQSEITYRTIASSIPGSVICLLDLDFRYVLVEGDMLEKFGFSKQNLLGKSIREIVSPERYAELVPNLNRVLRGESLTLETQRDSFATLDHYVPLVNKEGKVYQVMIVIIDITDQKNIVSILREYNDRYEAVSKATNDAIWDWDIEKDHEIWNHGIETIFGYHIREIKTTKRWWKEKIHPHDFERVFREIESAFNNKLSNWDSRYRYLCADGSYKYIHDKAVILYHEDKPIRMIGAMQDVSELVHYQLELETKVEERTNELKKALQAEKELVEMKSNFISVASHEFRTPLSTIYLAAGFIKRFKDKITPEQLISKLMAIDKQVAIMTYLLDDVLFVGKAESGKIEFQLDLVPLDILKSIAFEAMSSKPSGHKLEIESDYSITHVQTDERLLRNIIINLITNAIKFSPQSETIVMKIKCDEENLVISVIDTGIGISEEDQAKLFTSFFRGKNADTIEGTGLGLTILKKATEIMKGNVLINSKLGSGTEITVSLPLRF